MKLYSFAGSCALASHIVLEWIGKPYELALIERGDLDNPELLKLNPNHKVPILEDDGWVLTQNAAILQYLAETHPEAELHGDSPKSRAVVNSWLGLINSEVHPAFKAFFVGAPYLKDATVEDKMKAQASQTLRQYFSRLDQQLADKEWLTGQRSIADAYLFVTLFWANFLKLDMNGLDNLAAFTARMQADTAVQKALSAQGLA